MASVAKIHEKKAAAEKSVKARKTVHGIEIACISKIHHITN